MGKEKTMMTSFAAEITAMVCLMRGLKRQEVVYGAKTIPLTRARWFIWSLLRERGYSYSKIATMFGMHHTSVIHGVAKLNTEMPGIDWAAELRKYTDDDDQDSDKVSEERKTTYA